MLKIDQLSKHFIMHIRNDAKIEGFDGISFAVQAGELVGICREVHAMGKDVMTYTGYTYEELLEMQKTDEGVRQLLEETDTLVDGRFILAQRDLTLIYKGSRNQRIIDMNRTRAEGKLVLDPVEEENLRPEE